MSVNFGTADPSGFSALHNALFPYSPTNTQGAPRSVGFQATTQVREGMSAGVTHTQARATMASGKEFALNSTGVTVQQQIGGGVGMGFSLARARAMGAGATANGTILALTMSIALFNSPAIALQITRSFLQVDGAGRAQSTGIGLTVAPGRKR